MNLEQEAAKITEELGKVVFIGALAVNHTLGSENLEISILSQPDLLTKRNCSSLVIGGGKEHAILGTHQEESRPTSTRKTSVE